MKKNKKILTTLAILAVCAVIVVCSMSGIGHRVAGAMCGPFMSIFNWTVDVVVGDAETANVDGLSDKERIRQLEAQIAVLQAEVASVDELRLENNQLRNCARLGDFPGWVAVTAEIIARDPASWNTSMIVNRGTLDGIREGSVALAAGKVIGRVTKCYDHSSEIYTVLSSQCHFSVIVQGTEAVGICSGDDHSGNFKVDFLPKGVNPYPGQRLLTSGLGGWMPSGLEVGNIVEQDGKIQTVIDDSRIQVAAAPCAGFNRLRFLTILVPGEKL